MAVQRVAWVWSVGVAESKTVTQVGVKRVEAVVLSEMSSSLAGAMVSGWVITWVSERVRLACLRPDQDH
jgi:hypothetical protein